MNKLLPEYFLFSTDGENKFHAELQYDGKFKIRGKDIKFYTYDEVFKFVKNKKWIIIW
jgi:hypothetical protein